MKIQLPLENWAHLLELVPRHQLGEILSQIGDRQFAHIAQFSLHEYGKISVGDIRIVTLSEKNDSNVRPPVVEIQQNRFVDGKYIWITQNTNLPDWPMPRNIKNFMSIHLCYLDISVLNFMQQFHQNSMLSNVNLCLPELTKENLLVVLTRFMPLISSISSLQLGVYLLESVHDAGDSSEYSKLLAKMVEMPRIMEISCFYREMRSEEFDWCYLWSKIPREDGKPRVLILSIYYWNSLDCIEPFINRIKQDFLNAYHPISFFIRFLLPEHFHWQQDTSLENCQTNEELVIKMCCCGDDNALLISRYQKKVGNKWIEENEEEILDWTFYKQERKVKLDENLKIEV